MSTSEALAAVTETLRVFLFNNLGGPDCTVKPPDLARGENVGDQINVFLYGIARNAAWANMEPLNHAKPNESGRPPLALDLSYLITAYGNGNSDVAAQRALGRAMSLLHDHPVLGREEIRLVTPEARLHEQFERIRISHEPLALDEMTKLWTSFNTFYRLSTTYTVSVVLIDSGLPVRPPLPVLSRGEADSGLSVGAETPLFPALDRLELKEVRKGLVQPSARLGDTIVLFGGGLDDGTVRFTTAAWDTPVVLQPSARSASRIEVGLPPDTSVARRTWPAGLYTASVAVPVGSRARTTNELPFPLAPRILDIAPRTAIRTGGAVTLTITCGPEVRRGQRVSLLIGDREVSAEPLPAGTDSTDILVFTLENADLGTFVLRLQVDGVRSLAYRTDTLPRAFDPDQQVTIT
ncbi:DUF4255 domain-containing protein [Streptomyces sp. NPDC001530]|uniref:DUF4255 domain-containing protein n=1 Tax=Streptomyces sp. NPDC001530 TaxID=3364582 RepID=UPI0036C99AA6